MDKIGLGLDSHAIKLKVKSEKLSRRNSRGSSTETSGKVKKNLILGGVEVSKDYYALADSDGDVIIHSLCNALSTAIGGGSLDTWAGPMYKQGITDSKEFLKVILDKVRQQGFKISNVAIMLEAQQPKLEKFNLQIKQSLAVLMKIKPEDIGLAFTTGQDLTSFGQGKGIQVISTVLLFK